MCDFRNFRQNMRLTPLIWSSLSQNNASCVREEKFQNLLQPNLNLNLTWNASNHQYFVTAHPTPTQYFGLIVTAQPNLSLPWDASNLHQHFVTAHATPTQYKPV